MAKEKEPWSETRKLGIDSIEFREYCRYTLLKTDIIAMSKAMNDVLKDEDKKLIIDYLRAISEADGNVTIDEKKLLDQVILSFGV